MVDFGDINGNIYCFDGAMYHYSDSKRPFSFKGEVLRIYEVVRIINRVPLFFEEHFSRLQKSVEKKNCRMNLSMNKLADEITQIVSLNDLINCNCMIICFFVEDEFHYLIYPRKHYYPSEDEYLLGVSLEIIEVERPDPNIKYIDEKYNELTGKAKADPHIFEVLLVNHEGFITEASKANVFFIKDGIVITPPPEQVLLGITRQFAIEAIKNSGVQLMEKVFSVHDLEECDGVFISGTSIHLLPVSKVGLLSFRTPQNPIYLKLKSEFEKIVKICGKGSPKH